MQIATYEMIKNFGFVFCMLLSIKAKSGDFGFGLVINSPTLTKSPFGFNCRSSPVRQLTTPVQSFRVSHPDSCKELQKTGRKSPDNMPSKCSTG